MGRCSPFRGKRGNRNFFIAFWLCDCNDKRPFSHWKSSLLMACLEEHSLSFNLGLPLHFHFRRKRGERDFFIAFWLCDCNDNRLFLYRKVSGRLVWGQELLFSIDSAFTWHFIPNRKRGDFSSLIAKSLKLCTSIVIKQQLSPKTNAIGQWSSKIGQLVNWILVVFLYFSQWHHLLLSKQLYWICYC